MAVHPRRAQHHFTPDETNTRALREAFGQFATGVTIVTAPHEDGVVAITANSFSSVSLSPPLVLWSPDRNSRRFPYFEAARHYAIHVLATDHDALCWKVAKDAYGLRAHDLPLNEDGVPVLENCLARFDCTQKAVYDGGDHAIVLGQVDRVEMRQDGEALAFFKGKALSII
ncbi:MAG: flavin reductase family protein [Pseudomonadota bacterium]